MTIPAQHPAHLLYQPDLQVPVVRTSPAAFWTNFRQLPGSPNLSACSPAGLPLAHTHAQQNYKHCESACLPKLQHSVMWCCLAQHSTGCRNLPGSWTLSRRDLRSASAGGRILMLQALFSPAPQSWLVKHNFFGITATPCIKLPRYHEALYILLFDTTCHCLTLPQANTNRMQMTKTG